MFKPDARYDVDRMYEVESNSGQNPEPFPSWLRERCRGLPDAVGNDLQDLRALATLPSRRVCSFRSMMSHGSHYRVEEHEADEPHVTYDCGVAELETRTDGEGSSDQGGAVHIKRVGTLKDILVFDYVHTIIVVSWVAQDTAAQPRLRRDEHGFWIANMDARPRSSESPYILPSLASQVKRVFWSTE
jgi:hypothetical protein